ncbi:MAG: SDR family oxidoreductase [Candidatus Hydrogenedentes bacterium]|nr:SDR family oxidoreductase [Candidatus Hydrogenedentota bacterium]
MSESVWTIENKTVVITGASSGIGEATAIELARMGAHVVLMCRDKGKSEQTLADIREAVPNARADVVLANFASQQDVRSAAHEVLTRFDAVHVLINNAATVQGKRHITDDGIEMQFAVNHLAPFLLTNLLLPRIIRSAPARIVNVSSDMHQNARIEFDDLQSERSYSGMRVYGNTKLANILFTYQLARRLEGVNVTVNCLHPGVVATGIARDMMFPINVLARAAGLFMLSPANGAQTSVFLAASPEVSGVTGKYFVKKRERPSSPLSHDAESARKLWEISARMTGLPES